MSDISFFQKIKQITSLGLRDLPDPLDAVNLIGRVPVSLDDLRPNWLIDSDSDFEMFYAPFRWKPNSNAKVLLLGLTPGWTQALLAWKDVFDEFHDRRSETKSSKVAFGGPMRKILIQQLDGIGLNKYLNLESCVELFSTRKELASKSSILYFPVFKNGKNYSGHSPNPTKSPILQKWINLFLSDVLTASPNALVIPMGVSVEMVLKLAKDQGFISEEQCLWGFPHPSPANAHRYKIMAEKGPALNKACRDYFYNRKLYEN